MTTIEFYKVYLDKSSLKEIPKSFVSISNEFEKLLSKKYEFSDSDYDRDFYDVRKVDNYICGVFRKVRTGEPIKVGKTGEDGRDIPLGENEGKYETNHFVFVPDKKIICYLRNTHGNYYGRLENCLRKALKIDIQLSPLLNLGTVDTLLSNRRVLNMDFSIPIKPDLIPNQSSQWSDEALSGLFKSGADTVEFSVKTNLKRKDHGYIENAKATISNMLNKGAKKAQVRVEDIDGKRDLIDMIADKITYQIPKFQYTKENLPNNVIFEKIISGYLAKLDEINEVV